MRKKYTLDDILQPGISFSIFWNEGNINKNKRVHIRAIVDDTMVIVRVWSRHKLCWYYEIKDVYWYKLLLNSEDVVIRRVRRDKDYMQPIYDLMLEGNNGGDIFDLKDLGDGLIDLRVGHCCVVCVERVVPVELLTRVMDEALTKHGSVEGVFRDSGWPGDFVEELIDKMRQANEKQW
jgi:hypothetical protein